jgi:ribosomal protein S18 acetylase RimI-like enzyme
LVAQGWERRFTADEQRAREAIELYEKLGFEVRAEPVRPNELEEDCEDCRTVVAFRFLTIYTRRKSG